MNIKSQRLTAIFEAMADGICITSQEYTIEFMNRAMVKNFGKGIGKKCYKILEKCNDICTRCEASRVFKGETVHQEVYNKIVDKTYDIVEMPLKNDNGTVSKLSIFRDISHKKRQEEKLKDSEQQYRRLFEHVGCGVYISSKEGKFLDANRALLEMLGYDNKEEFLNIDIAKDLYVRSEDRQKFREMIEKDGRVIDYEVEFKRKDGSTIPMLLTGHVRHDEEGNIIGYEGINVDQTHRKKMEREIREAHDFLNKIIQNSPNAIMATDMKGNVIIWNRAAEESFGYKAEDVIGKINIRKIYPEGGAKKVMQVMRSSSYGRSGRLRFYPIVNVRKDGSLFEGSLSAAIVYDENMNEIASVGTFVDLEEKIEMERKLKQTREQLLQSEKLAAMGRLTSQVAHELNNPLYGIMNTLELLKTEIAPENRRRKILDMALSEIVRLSEILRKMLSFSKPDQEKKIPVDINTVLEEILLLHEKQLKELNITISTIFPEDNPPVKASKNQLRQVFLNVIANARDAMSEGGTLTVSTLNSDDNEVRVELSDTGVGIPEENIGKIFDTFFTTKSSVKGVGLGLSVCYGFIKDHGGDILVESTPGSGTKFTVVLPACEENSKDLKEG